MLSNKVLWKGQNLCDLEDEPLSSEKNSKVMAISYQLKNLVIDEMAALGYRRVRQRNMASWRRQP